VVRGLVEELGVDVYRVEDERPSEQRPAEEDVVVVPLRSDPNARSDDPVEPKL
jgi:hypothetical protein